MLLFCFLYDGKLKGATQFFSTPFHIVTFPFLLRYIYLSHHIIYIIMYIYLYKIQKGKKQFVSIFSMKKLHLIAWMSICRIKDGENMEKNRIISTVTKKWILYFTSMFGMLFLTKNLQHEWVNFLINNVFCCHWECWDFYFIFIPLRFWYTTRKSLFFLGKSFFLLFCNKAKIIKKKKKKNAWKELQVIDFNLKIEEPHNC